MTQKDEYLKRPYARIVIPDEGGGYYAELLEFPGCFASGSTVTETFSNLESAAESWVQVALANGQDIPEPSSNIGFGGKIALRLPRSLHKQAVRFAERDGTSLNQFLVSAIAAKVGAEDLFGTMARRLENRIIVTAANVMTSLPPESIRATRRKLGLTQAGLACALATTSTTVARWERGEAKPSPGAVKRIMAIRDGKCPTCGRKTKMKAIAKNIIAILVVAISLIDPISAAGEFLNDKAQGIRRIILPTTDRRIMEVTGFAKRAGIVQVEIIGGTGLDLFILSHQEAEQTQRLMRSVNEYKIPSGLVVTGSGRVEMSRGDNIITLTLFDGRRSVSFDLDPYDSMILQMMIQIVWDERMPLVSN